MPKRKLPAIELPAKPAELIAAEAVRATAQAEGRAANDHLANLRRREPFGGVGLDEIDAAEAAVAAMRVPAEAASSRVAELRRAHAAEAAKAASPAVAAMRAEILKNVEAIESVATSFAAADKEARALGFGLAGLPVAATIVGHARLIRSACNAG